jgi:hypothetical protein
MDAHERFQQIVARVSAKMNAEQAAAASRRLLDMSDLTGRPERRIPRPLQGAMSPERLVELFGDQWVNPDSGGLFGQRAIETYVATADGLADMLRLSRAQLYRSGLYEEPWTRRVGDLVALNVGSLHGWLARHHEAAVAAHCKALGVDVGGGSNVPVNVPTTSQNGPSSSPREPMRKEKTPR